jgi:hypothetical protein
VGQYAKVCGEVADAIEAWGERLAQAMRRAYSTVEIPDAEGLSDLEIRTRLGAESALRLLAVVPELISVRARVQQAMNKGELGAAQEDFPTLLALSEETACWAVGHLASTFPRIFERSG